MARQRYSIKEALNRLVRIFQNESPASDVPTQMHGELLSVDEALSDLVELFAQSYPSKYLTYPFPIIFAPATSIPSGTFSHLGGVLWAEGGALKWYGASGTITTLAGA